MFDEFFKYFDDNQAEFYNLVKKLYYHKSIKETFFGFELSFADRDEEYDDDCECQMLQIILNARKGDRHILIRAFAYNGSYEGFEVDTFKNPEQVEAYEVTITKYREV